MRPSVGPSTGLRTNGLGGWRWFGGAHHDPSTELRRAGWVLSATVRWPLDGAQVERGGVKCDCPLALGGLRLSATVRWPLDGAHQDPWTGLRLSVGVLSATVRWPLDGAQDDPSTGSGRTDWRVGGGSAGLVRVFLTFLYLPNGIISIGIFVHEELLGAREVGRSKRRNFTR